MFIHKAVPPLVAVLINPWCERKTTLRILRFFAILLTALALVPGGAHVQERANNYLATKTM
ncbi:MAG: hypothetical protein QOF90_1165 [Acetobacteraceae bacterium]|nr:hypothetical protein [Acetobacteraceae bacterium]MEA2788597.1 hypothetical protein [Acetobacteraceae bacterium]